MTSAVSVVRLAQGLSNILTGGKKAGFRSFRTNFQYHFPPTARAISDVSGPLLVHVHTAVHTAALEMNPDEPPLLDRSPGAITWYWLGLSPTAR